MSNGLQDMNFFLVIFGLVTDRQTDRRKAMHMSPPCMGTGGLNKKYAVPRVGPDIWSLQNKAKGTL